MRKNEDWNEFVDNAKVDVRRDFSMRYYVCGIACAVLFAVWAKATHSVETEPGEIAYTLLVMAASVIGAIIGVCSAKVFQLVEN